jgi:hypothetical protein
MVDGDSKPLSIERCRELLGAESSGLSDEEVEAVRDQTNALIRVIVDIYLDQQQQEQDRATDERGSVPVGRPRKVWRSTSGAHAYVGKRERRLAQICPRWNRMAVWLREAEGYSRAA